MNDHDKLADLLICIQDDCQEWRDVPGRTCLRWMREIGLSSVQAVADAMRATTDIDVHLNVAYLLVYFDTPESADALTDVIHRPLDEEVLERIFDDAGNVLSLLQHPRFITKARERSVRWPNPSLMRFLLQAEVNQKFRSSRPPSSPAES